MGNAINAFDFELNLATFLASPVSDGTYADLLTTLKFDKVGQEAQATDIDAAAGQLWGNLADDFILATYPFFYQATKIWRRDDTAALFAMGSDDALAVADIGYTDADSDFFYVVSVDGASASTWALMSPSETTTGRGNDGSHTVAGTETLTRDMYYQDLTVPDGTVLETDGFKVWAANSITIGSTGTIRNNGANGVGAVAGAGAPAGSLNPGTTGGTGMPGAGGNGANPTADTSGGNTGGAGGAGGAGAAGAAGVLDPPQAIQGGGTDATGNVNIGFPQHATVIGANGGAGGIIVLGGGTGGGGGGGDGAERGGGGGGGGGVVVLSCRTLINNGTIEAIGGTGGDGSAVGGDTGGGGGGGGGLVITIARKRTGSGSINVSGGAGGMAGNSGDNGVAGSDGYVQEYDA